MVQGRLLRDTTSPRKHIASGFVGCYMVSRGLGRSLLEDSSMSRDITELYEFMAQGFVVCYIVSRRLGWSSLGTWWIWLVMGINLYQSAYTTEL